MNKFFLVTLIFCSIAAVSQSFSPLASNVTCKNQLLEKYNTITSITANFKENTHSNLLQNDLVGEGKITYEAKNKIRWEKYSPNSEVLLLNGTSVNYQKEGKIISNPATNQMIKKIKTLMLMLLNGDFLSSNEFEITYFQNNLEYKLILTPTNKKISSYLSSITLFFSKSDLSLSNFVFHINSEEYTEYQITNSVYNKDIKSTLFTTF